MKVSVNWLKEYTKIDVLIDELVEKIGAQLGAIEEVIDIGKKYDGITIAKVVSCVKHPDADKLSLCKIDTGKEQVQIVCGAPNVREGLLVVWIPPGITVPATFDKDPLILEARKIRGEISNGMLASAHELGISDDHTGIVEIDKGNPGDDFAKAYGLDDYIIDIENKMLTHRPDCFGLLGVAREIAGIQHKPFKSPKWYLGDKTTGEHNDDKELLTVKNELPGLVPRFMAQIVENVEIKPSSLDLQIALSKIGIKSINNIVDVTNYTMHLTGQPLHAYDYDKLKKLSGSNPTIVVRKPKSGEKVKVLGGKTIEPHKDAIMIATDKHLIGIGGVIGGADTEVDAKTKNIVLECANFDLYSIRRTSMHHGLFTDAVTRFSKGQSALQNDRVLANAVDNMIHESGGIPARSIYDLKSNVKPQEPLQVDVEFINARLGLNLPAEDIITLLRNVEFLAEITRGSVLIIKPPFWRTDIEIAEDIVEEVGRLYGYDKLPLELPKSDLSPIKGDKNLQTKQNIRTHLSNFGANEVLTYSFVHSNLLDSVGQDKKEAFKIANALSPDLQYYRLSIVPSLLAKIHANIKLGFDDFALYEIGKVYGKSEIDEDGLPKELGRLGFVITDDYFSAKKYLESLYKNSKFEYKTFDQAGFFEHKMAKAMMAPFELKRSAFVFINGKPAGVLGEFKSAVRKKLKLPGASAGFELFLSSIKDSAKSNYRPLSKFPPTHQDISLKTDKNLSFAELKFTLEKSLQKNAPKDVKLGVECIDIFAKDDMHKNTAFRINAVSYDRTLTTDLISTLLEKTSSDLKQSIGAERI